MDLSKKDTRQLEARLKIFKIVTWGLFAVLFYFLYQLFTIEAENKASFFVAMSGALLAFLSLLIRQIKDELKLREA